MTLSNIDHGEYFEDIMEYYLKLETSHTIDDGEYRCDIIMRNETDDMLDLDAFIKCFEQLHI